MTASFSSPPELLLPWLVLSQEAGAAAPGEGVREEEGRESSRHNLARVVIILVNNGSVHHG